MLHPLRVLTLTNDGFHSCYSHAVAIGEGSFLSALSLKPKDLKTAKAAPATSHGASNADEIDDDDKDTEEEIKKMLKELEATTSDLEQIFNSPPKMKSF
jgi:hypothetical protein